MIYMALLHLKRLLIQSKRGVILTILMPTVIVSVVTFFSKGVKSDTTIYISAVNNDNGVYGSELLKSLKNDNVEISYISYETAKFRIKENSTALVLVIPKEFTEKIKNGEKPSVQIFKALGKDADSAILSELNSFVGKKMVLNKTSIEVQSLDKSLDRHKFEKAMERNFKDKYVSITSGYITDGDIRSSGGDISTNLTISFLMYSMIYIVIDVYELKKEKILLRSLSTPNKNSSILGSIFLAMVALLFIQSSILVFVTKVVFNMYWGRSMAAVMLVFLALDLVVLSAGLVVVKLVKDESQIAPIISLTVTLTCAVGGSFVPLDTIPNIPSIVKKISYFTPQNWAVSALNDVALKNSGVYDILPKLLILLLFAGAFFAAGTLRLRETAKE